MRIDPTGDRTMREALDRPGPRRRRPWLKLLAEIMGLAEHCATLVRHREQPWASVTFSGTRHSVTLAFAGPEAIAAGERLITALPDHEFSVRGQLVADTAVTEVEHTSGHDERLVVTCELLLLDEA
jgi:hypothetical protein